jgi:RNA polymerase sigma-70 factor (ECF subfamily)
MRLIKQYGFQETDTELVNGCKKNDRKFQKNLYDRYKNAMFSTALRIAGDHDLANDALQEAFIDVFENIGSFRFESSLGAWIKTIVIRKSIRRLKLEKCHEPLEEVEHIEAIETDFDFTADDLDKAINSLPESARAVFLLIEVEGYKHQEVAEILGISVGTSKSQLNYSKKLLQRRLYEKV